MTSPLVIVAAAPRTGSNMICNVLSGFERHKAHSEIFARDYPYTLEQPELLALEEMTGCILPRDKLGNIEPRTPTTTQLVYDEPGAVLDAIALTRQPQHTSVSFKLFGYHLPRAVTRFIFERMDPAVIVVKRRLIDSYASKLKAQQLQRWVWADTTYVKVTADIRDFKYWYQRHKSWYEHVEAYDADTLYYEEGFGSVDSLEHALRAMIPHDLGEWDASICRLRPLTKQDRNTEPGDKIANWDEFAAELEAEGLYDDAMGYF